MEKLSRIFRGDVYIWMCVFALSLLGILAVYSATGSLAFSKQGGNTEFYFMRHTGFLVVSLAVMYLFHLIDYRYFSKLSLVLLGLSVVLLVVTLFVGSDINEAKRVLPIPGLGLTFQTSDMAKLFLVMYIARYLAKSQDEVDNIKTFYRIMAVICVVVLLIAPENLSPALVLFSTCMLLLFIGRINIKYLAMIFFAGVITLTVFFYTLVNITPGGWADGTRIGTWKKRVETYIDKDSEGSFQTQQAKIAVATGGFFGKGPGGSTQRNFLPHPYSDFIYAIIIEEYGLMGGVFTIFIFLLLLYRCIRIVIKTPKAFGALLAVGLCFSMVIQAFVNMGVATSLLPVTGLTIPLVSMGGTSMLFTSIAFGVILSVSRTVDSDEASENAAVAGNQRQEVASA